MMKKVVLLLLVLVMVGLPVHAQGDRERVTLVAEDGLELVGTYYGVPEAADAESAPAVLLAHQGNGAKERWFDTIPAFQAAGYAVLAIDQRGHGETGGSIVTGAQLGDDIRLWLDWLAMQSGIDAEHLNIVGASLGGDMSLPVVADDDRIRSMTVISPMLELNGVRTDEALAAVGDLPVFFVATAGDVASMEAVHAYMDIEGANIMVRVYDTTACCTGLFMLERDLLPTIVAWLTIHNG